MSAIVNSDIGSKPHQYTSMAKYFVNTQFPLRRSKSVEITREKVVLYA